MPEYLDTEKLFDHEKKLAENDEFEQIEIDENQMKLEMHKTRAGMALGDIL